MVKAKTWFLNTPAKPASPTRDAGFFVTVLYLTSAWQHSINGADKLPTCPQPNLLRSKKSAQIRMNIVVLGAGTVGISISKLLCEHGHSVTVVDQDASKIRLINEQLDVRAITGSASMSSVLFQAGISTADICMAVTGTDEVNIVASSLARAMGARRSIARVFAPVFHDLSTFDYQEHFGIDRMLSLEQLTALELANHLRDPGSAVFEQFARGGLEVHEIIINEESGIAGRPLHDLKMKSTARIGTISRNGKMRIARANDKLEVGDRILAFCKPDDVSAIKNRFKQNQEQRRRVIIAGGGETGFHLALKLQSHRFSVTLMDSDEHRCAYLAKNLKHTQVLHCNACQWEVLQEEGVGHADTFVACLGNDENNILAGVEARDIGAAEIMAVVNRPDYANITSKLGIDVAVSAREVMARSIVSYLQEGLIIRSETLPGSDIELIELKIAENSLATRVTLAEFELNIPFLICALVRKDYVKVPTADDQLRPGDHIVLLVEDHNSDSIVGFFTTTEP